MRPRLSSMKSEKAHVQGGGGGRGGDDSKSSSVLSSGYHSTLVPCQSKLLKANWYRSHMCVHIASINMHQHINMEDVGKMQMMMGGSLDTP